MSVFCATDLFWLIDRLGTVYSSLTPNSCEDQFIKFDGKTLHRDIPGALRSSVYVRPLYWKLLVKLEEAWGCDASVVTGNPGEALYKGGCMEREGGDSRHAT